MRLSSLAPGVALGWALLLGFPASLAHAGPLETARQIVFHPTDQDRIVLRFGFGGGGLVETRDGGDTWTLLPFTFLDPTTYLREGPAALANDGTLFVGSFPGALEDDGNGCEWAINADIGERFVTDLVRDPDDPDVLYAVTGNGGEGFVNGIWRRDAGGDWTMLADQEELAIFRMRVVSTGGDDDGGARGRRFVQSATRGVEPITLDGGMESQATRYVIRVSDDDAATWQEHPYPLLSEGSLSLAGVDPSDPDRMVVVIDRAADQMETDWLHVSTDGGQTFTPYLEVSDFGGLVITPVGRVFVADFGVPVPDHPAGLWRADSLDDEPTKLIDTRLTGLGYRAETDTLAAATLVAFGELDQDSGEMTEWTKYREVERIVECEGVDVAMMVERQLCRDYCLYSHHAKAPACAVYQSPACGPCSDLPEPAPLCELTAGTGGTGGGAGQGGGSDASVTGGGEDAGTDPPDDGKGGDGDCSCDALGARRTAPGALLGCLIALWLAAFARRRYS